MDDRVFQATLAGLLHDVGKFAQRAGELGSRTWDSEAERDYKYQHALYSGDFVEKYVPKQWRTGLSGPARHHRPQTHHDRVVALADWLSAGERADEHKDHPRQLQSIFLSVGQASSLSKKYLPLKSLAIEQAVIFPGSEINDSDAAYKVLWDEFERKVQDLGQTQSWNEQTQEFYLNGILDLMQRYTWCIPSAYYRSVPDVSLYDHSRMTAALAACLVEQPDAKIQAWLNQQNQDEPVALLVGGDISGVQKFIYTITSRGAAKSLRGRSFYLQLLTEAVARYVLSKLGLPVTNLIYAGGGNFYLVAATNQGDLLRQIATEVTQLLLNAHDGALHLILASHPVSPDKFQRKHFYRAWDKLLEGLNRAKLKPLGDLNQEAFSKEIGEGLGEGGNTDRLCNVCGREADQGEHIIQDESGGAPIRICGMCESLADLGNKLVKATHLVTVYSKPPVQPNRHVDTWWKGLENFGVKVWPVDVSTKANDYISKLPSDAFLIDVNTLPKTGRFSSSLIAELDNTRIPVLETFRLFAQLVAKGHDGLPLTFDELAQNKTDRQGVPLAAPNENYSNNYLRWSGLKRWGVLRIDVDNLGKLFRDDFKYTQKNGSVENNLTLSRLANLSFALRLFFEGWLPHLGQKPGAPDRLVNRLYLQYAGGDDLFVVGSWDALPEFAANIQASFAEYVCQNPEVTLSGGVALADEKYPLYQAANDAELAETAAKDYRQVKNAFCFLGQPVGWEEFGEVMALAYNLAEWCGEDGLVSRALLQTLLSIHAEYQAGRSEALKNGKWKPTQIYYGAWMWRLAYQLGRRVEELNRRIEHKNTSTQLKEKLMEIREALKQIERDMLDKRKIETIGLAARWAQYLIRK